MEFGWHTIFKDKIDMIVENVSPMSEFPGDEPMGRWVDAK
jgi:hypothetical protein